MKRRTYCSPVVRDPEARAGLANFAQPRPTTQNSDFEDQPALTSSSTPLQLRRPVLAKPVVRGLLVVLACVGLQRKGVKGSSTRKTLTLRGRGRVCCCVTSIRTKGKCAGDGEADVKWTQRISRLDADANCVYNAMQALQWVDETWGMFGSQTATISQVTLMGWMETSQGK